MKRTGLGEMTEHMLRHIAILEGRIENLQKDNVRLADAIGVIGDAVGIGTGGEYRTVSISKIIETIRQIKILANQSLRTRLEEDVATPDTAAEHPDHDDESDDDGIVYTPPVG